MISRNRTPSEYVYYGLHKEILALSISKERNMLLAERFLLCLVKVHGKHTVLLMGEHDIYRLADFFDSNITFILHLRKV